MPATKQTTALASNLPRNQPLERTLDGALGGIGPHAGLDVMSDIGR